MPPQTRAQLRLEMAKSVSTSETPGYIYVHEMTPTPTSTTSLLKIGRSVKPIARLEQWKQTCPTRQPLVRDFFPLPSSHPILRRLPHLRAAGTDSSPNQLSPQSNGGSRLRGALSVQQPCPFHHRWERLVLLEVGGRASMSGYAPDGMRKKERSPCEDCGKVHIELFTLLP